jgi:hypothetical protein
MVDHLKPKPSFDFFLYFHPRVHRLKIPNPLPEHPYRDYDYSEGLDNQIEFEFFDPIQPKYLLSRRHYPTAGIHILAIAHVRKRVNLEREVLEAEIFDITYHAHSICSGQTYHC